MTPQEKAYELIGKYKLLLLQSDTEMGEEILCSVYAKQCALIAVDFAREFVTEDLNAVSFDKAVYLFEVKQEIEKL